MTPPLSVHLFARYAELLGTTQIDVPGEHSATVAALVRYLRTLPGGAALPERPFVAVNLAQADSDYRPRQGDEIALLPPMAGG